jgi:hypothetical protein
MMPCFNLYSANASGYDSSSCDRLVAVRGVTKMPGHVYCLGGKVVVFVVMI